MPSTFFGLTVAGSALSAFQASVNTTANNISNVSTPGYKRQDVDFESQLKRALGNTRYKTVDERVSNIRTSQLSPTVYTDSVGFSYRLDKNNVDMDTEGAYLAANQIKYNGLIDCVNQEFSNLSMVMK